MKNIKAKAISITMPMAMYENAEQLAKKENRTISELVREALRRYETVQEFRELQSYGIRQAKKMGIKQKDVNRLIEEVRNGQ
jgi:predicted DNA-binding protein